MTRARRGVSRSLLIVTLIALTGLAVVSVAVFPGLSKGLSAVTSAGGILGGLDTSEKKPGQKDDACTTDADCPGDEVCDCSGASCVCLRSTQWQPPTCDDIRGRVTGAVVDTGQGRKAVYRFAIRPRFCEDYSLSVDGTEVGSQGFPVFAHAVPLSGQDTHSATFTVRTPAGGQVSLSGEATTDTDLLPVVHVKGDAATMERRRETVWTVSAGTTATLTVDAFSPDGGTVTNYLWNVKPGEDAQWTRPQADCVRQTQCPVTFSEAGSTYTVRVSVEEENAPAGAPAADGAITVRVTE